MATLLLLGAAGLGPALAQQAQHRPRSPWSRSRSARSRRRSRFTGRVEAKDKVDLRARVEGFLEKRLFEEGQDVKAGDLLFVIEKAPYQAAIENVDAAIARAQATLDLAEIEQRRQAELVKKQATAQARLDDATAKAGEARGDLRRQQANLTTAELNLGYTDIKAPIAGRIGRATYLGRQFRRTVQRHAGHDRQPGPDLRDLPGHPARSCSRCARATRTPVPIRRQDGQGPPRRRQPSTTRSGKLNFVDVQVNQGTDTVQVRATLPNPKRCWSMASW